MAFSNMEAALDAPLLRVDDASISASSVSTQKRDASAGAGVFALLIALTVGDIVLGAILFDRFGEIYAQYLNLATAACYCVASTAAVLWRRAPRRAPARLLVVIGVLNGGGNFFQAVGQPHTPGITQSLLSATLSVPLVLLLSLLFLGKRPSRTAAGAAALVVAGAACGAFRSRLGASHALIDAGGEDDGGAGGIVVEWYAVALFAVAQLVFSAERVFEESVFARALEGLDATTMFCWTMWVQFVLYLPLLPSQQLPALGGLTPPQILPVERDGLMRLASISILRRLLGPQFDFLAIICSQIAFFHPFFFSNNDRRASVAFRREIHRDEVGMETAERGPAAEKDTGKKKEKEENK